MIEQIALAPFHGGLWPSQLLYIGPGMDGGTISLIIAFLISFFTFLAAIIWYPIKKVIAFFKVIFGKPAPNSPEKAGNAHNQPAEGKA